MTDETCTQCGATLHEGAAFCTSCGASLASGGEPVADSSSSSPPEDVTRVEQPGLQGETRVLPETPPPSEASSAGWAAPSAPPPPPPPAGGGWAGQASGEGWGQAPSGAAPSSWGAPSSTSWDQPGAPAAAAWPTSAPAPADSAAAGSGAPASAIVGIIGALLTIVGLFLPWVSAKTGTTLSLVANKDSLTGWALATESQVRIKTDDPYALLALGLVALAVSLVLFARSLPLLRIALAVVGVVIVGLTIYDVTSIRSVVQDSFTTEEGVDLQLGLWLTLAGGIICIVAACLPGSKRSGTS